jgi:hypothetical protein
MISFYVARTMSPRLERHATKGIMGDVACYRLNAMCHFQ